MVVLLKWNPRTAVNMKPMKTGSISYAHYVAMIIGKYSVAEMRRIVVGTKVTD
jgi:hypothetical protein